MSSLEKAGIEVNGRMYDPQGAFGIWGQPFARNYMFNNPPLRIHGVHWDCVDRSGQTMQKNLRAVAGENILGMVHSGKVVESWSDKDGYTAVVKDGQKTVLDHSDFFVIATGTGV